MKTITYDETKWRMVPVDLASRVQDSLGRFTSDEGFGQEDVDTADDFDAALSVAPTPPGFDDIEDIESLRKDAERYRWIRTEAARFKGLDDAGALMVSVTYRERRSDGDGFTGLLITPRDHDFDAAIDAAMAAGGE